jgi:hypothetical protein
MDESLGGCVGADIHCGVAMRHCRSAQGRAFFLYPLFVLCNWEKDLAVWAPRFNVVSLCGTAEARKVGRFFCTLCLCCALAWKNL